jgi:hypothetical protein
MEVNVVAVRQGSWSLVGGLLLGAGWWCVVDGLGVGSSFLKDPASVAAASYAWLPLLGAMVAFLMINCMMWGELQDNPRQPTVAGKARVFLLLALFVLMASVAGAAFIMVDKFLSQTGAYNWAGSESSRARERTRARVHESAGASTLTRERRRAHAHEGASARARARESARARTSETHGVCTSETHGVCSFLPACFKRRNADSPCACPILFAQSRA